MNDKKIMLRLMSHRAVGYLLDAFPDAVAYYYIPTLFKHNPAKGYYLVPDDSERVNQIYRRQGITKARDQNLDHYGQCWMV